MKADHFAFEVSDLDAAIAFYRDALGLTLAFREVDDEHHEAFAFLQLEGGNLELLQCLDEKNCPVPRERPDVRPSYSPHIALATENLAGVITTLKKKGVEILKGPMEIAGKVRWLYVADPDNNVVEFVEWLE